jgi:hypothetical protein
MASVAEGLPAEWVEPQARDLGDRGSEVVVGTELETGGHVIDPVCHGERHAAPGGDDPPGDLVARAGNVAVENRQIAGVAAQQFQRGAAVDSDQLRPETVPDGLGQVGFVRHDRRAHASRLSSTAYRRHMQTRSGPVSVTMIRFAAAATSDVRREASHSLPGLGRHFQ